LADLLHGVLVDEDARLDVGGGDVERSIVRPLPDVQGLLDVEHELTSKVSTHALRDRFGVADLDEYRRVVVQVSPS